MQNTRYRGMQDKICSIVVTYNRLEELKKCVQSLLKQTVRLDILIFDNNSSDGTEEWIKEVQKKNDNILYYKNAINLGGAGGFCNGLKRAYEIGYDFYWLMDDDGRPYDETTLETCLEMIKSEEKIIVNPIVTPNKIDLSFPLLKYHKINEMIEKESVVNGISPFNGTLITHACVSEIGYPKEDFFIKGDEKEYSLRAQRKGYSLITVKGAFFYHPQLQDEKIKIVGKEIIVTEESYWKEYYKARNYVYIYKNYYGITGILKHLIYCLLKLLLFKQDVKRKRRYLIKGFKDGICNKYENIVIKS